MDIDNRIKQIREQKRIKQVEVSDALDMNNSFYAKLEKRGKKLTIEQVEKIAGALGVTVAELLGLDISPKIEQVIDTSEKDKEIGELKKRVAELEDRVKDKENLLQVKDLKIQVLVDSINEFIEFYFNGVANELGLLVHEGFFEESYVQEGNEYVNATFKEKGNGDKHPILELLLQSDCRVAKYIELADIKEVLKNINGKDKLLIWSIFNFFSKLEDIFPKNDEWKSKLLMEWKGILFRESQKSRKSFLEGLAM